MRDQTLDVLIHRIVLTVSLTLGQRSTWRNLMAREGSRQRAKVSSKVSQTAGCLRQLLAAPGQKQSNPIKFGFSLLEL